MDEEPGEVTDTPDTEKQVVQDDESEVLYPVDESCFLCVGLPEHPSDEDKKTMTDREFHYSYGFALGVATSLRGAGPHYCPRHHTTVRRAMLAQGVNWGAPNRRERRVVS